jgi:hypothetical protein
MHSYELSGLAVPCIQVLQWNNKDYDSLKIPN